MTNHTENSENVVKCPTPSLHTAYLMGVGRRVWNIHKISGFDNIPALLVQLVQYSLVKQL